MTKWKKAISSAVTAALLASLFTIVAVPAVSAAVTVTPAGNVPQGGSSVGTATFKICEESVAALPNSAGTIDIAILDSASANTLGFSGTPVVTAPGSLGASAAIVTPNIIRFSWTNSDILNIECIEVSGLTIDDLLGAALGAIKATLQTPTGAGVSVADFQAGGTASGTIVGGIGIGATSVVVNVTTPGCLFTAPGTLTFVTSPETKAITAASALGVPAAGQQTLTIAATVNVHGANEVVTEATACAPNGILASPGTVVATLTYANPLPKLTVFPGENNSPATNLVLTEPSAGFLPAASTFTYTIGTAGVVFSQAPVVSDNNAVMVLSAPVLSADRKSATVTVTTASTVGGATITLSSILYDVAASVPAGTFISVGVATSGSLSVSPASRTNAVVFRGLAGVSATTPTVYIGENNQPAGIVSFTESAAGFFTDGTGTNNTFAICPFGVNYTFTVAPWAKVTGGVAAGNLILREGAGASPDNIVAGTQTGNCFTWTVFTKSTTASTIQIGNSDFTTGPPINVAVNQPPGAVMLDIFIGDGTVISLLLPAATVQFATAAFRNQVVVTALAQPAIPAGSSKAAMGSIQIAETGLGQLKNGELLCFEILPRANNTGTGTIQDTFLSSLNTADLPIATTSGSGLLVGSVIANPTVGQCGAPAGGSPTTFTTRFAFMVGQQSIAGDGKVVVSNINVTTTADAINGPILVKVSGLGGAPTTVQFQATISPARIGAAAAGTTTTRLGVTQVGSFTTSTKVAKVTKYVTYRINFGIAAAGKTIEIWGATKTGNDWSAFSKVTARVANASGVVYYYIRQNAPTWKSYRGFWAGGGVWSPARQSRWIP